MSEQNLIQQDKQGKGHIADDRICWRPDVPERSDRYWRFRSDTFFYEFGPRVTTIITPELWQVVSQTPKGFWLQMSYGSYGMETLYGRKKFILGGRGRRWAYQSKQEAWESFLIRLKWRHIHHERNADRLESVQSVVDAYQNKQGGDT